MQKSECSSFICFVFNIFVIFQIFFSYNLYAQNWPSLFTQEDIIPQNKNDLKLIEKLDANDIAKMAPEKVREKIFNSYYFFADFYSSTKGEEPRGWFDSHKDPEKSLWVGFPPDLKRPPLNIFYPAYNLTKLANFISDDPFVSKLNICQNFWVQNRLQMAYNCFFFLQLDLVKNGIPLSSLVRVQVNILHAFFLLQLATNDVTDVHTWNSKTIPPTPDNFTEGDHYALCRVLFTYVATQVDDSIYLPNLKTSPKVNVIAPIYQVLYNSPVYFRFQTKILGSKTSVVMLNSAVDSLKWVQTVMPVVYANTMTMNQGMLFWQRAFDAASKLENYFKNFNYPSMPEISPINIKKPAVVKSEIFISPKNNTDLLATTDLFRAMAMLIGKDPGNALEYISRGLFRKGNPEISSLLFNMSANSYFDLDLLRWARRSYSWAELFSKSYAEKVPSSLLFGAESAYWYGNYDVAKNAYERFLKLVGDRQYAPWVYLRLAEIDEIKGNNNNAKDNYEIILRNFDESVVSEDAQVRLYCLYRKGFIKNTKKVEYQKVLNKIKNARLVLKKQAKACLLKTDLETLTEDSVKDDKKNVVEKSLEQVKIIETYEKEFPKSEFISLFTNRIKELELSMGTFLASENACLKLINYYSKNRNSLNQLTKNNHNYVKGLKWDNQDKLKLLRCAAFVDNISIWNEMRKTEVGKDGNPLQDIFYNLLLKPSVENALISYKSLKNSSNEWIKKIQKIEKSTFDIITREDFWEMLTLRELMKLDLLLNKSASNLLNIAIARDLFANPKLIYSSNTFCYWMLRASNLFTEKEWVAVAQTKDKSQWLSLHTDLKEQKNYPCEAALAKNLLTISISHPTAYLDKNILIPSLEYQGIANGSENWLQYAQRLEKERGNKDKEVQDIYRKLMKESKEPLVKDAAGMWIKKNIPQEADKFLW
jgi:hypothetical protein